MWYINRRIQEGLPAKPEYPGFAAKLPSIFLDSFLKLYSLQVHKKKIKKPISYIRDFPKLITSFTLRKEGGDSWTLCWILRRVLTYSTNLFMKIIKCSALRMLPGTASSRTSFGRIGLANARSVSLAIWASRKPSTNR
jgi:hypothetical protein